MGDFLRTVISFGIALAIMLSIVWLWEKPKREHKKRLDELRAKQRREGGY